MTADNILKFAIKLNDNVMRCVIIPDGDCYKVELDDEEVAAIRLNENDKWMIAAGRVLPPEFVDEVGMHIEARYREAPFSDS